LYARYNLPTVIALIVLLAATAAAPKVEMFPAPKGHLPTEIARRGDGIAFVSWTNWPALEPHFGTVDAKGRIATTPLEKDHMPALFAAGSDGSLWLSDARRTVLWHVPESGEPRRVEIDRPTLGIVVDADGVLWCTHPGLTEISRYDLAGTKSAALDTGRGRFKLAPAKPQQAPAGMTPTWAAQSQKANRRDVTPAWLVNGPDATLWFSDPTMRSIGVVTLDGHQRRFRLPPDWGAPGALIVATDGLTWFTIAGKARLGQVSVDGVFSSVDIDEPATAIATDGKGRVWFATSRALAYLDGDGRVHSIALPKPPHVIRSIAASADGAMWFADQSTKSLGRVRVP
jgi:streptogramin lyase